MNMIPTDYVTDLPEPPPDVLAVLLHEILDAGAGGTDEDILTAVRYLRGLYRKGYVEGQASVLSTLTTEN